MSGQLRRPRVSSLALAIPLLAGLLGAEPFGAPLGAKVLRLEVESRVDLPTVLEDRTVPPYEKLGGWVVFGVDPTSPRNARIADLAFAETNDQGLVEARATFTVLRPKRAEDDRGVAFLEVSNRGGKASLRYFNAAGSSSRDPRTAEHLGDGLLLRLGLTVIWVGWQLDVPPGEGVLHLEAPPISDRGRAIYGWVRSDWVVDEPSELLRLGHRNHRAYPPAADLRDHRLYVRSGREAQRKLVPLREWSFVGLEDGPQAFAVRREGGFEAGKIYELVYRSGEPRLVGLGLAAMRDMMAYAKYDPGCPFPVDRGVGFGVSQTGRFLRHFLYQGFNADEEGRRVFDGLLIHTAGAGRGSFNHRFAQPSRDAHRYSAFFYPTDLFPFAGRTLEDPVSGVSDGLLRVYAEEPELVPRIFYTNTGYEYWGRAASLLHVTPDGKTDVEPLASERIYHLASTQHFSGRWPVAENARLQGSRAYRGNPADLLVPLRALLVRLVEWAADGREPPPSRFPKLADGSLVAFEGYRFPELAGLARPLSPHVAYRADYGPNWPRGVIDDQPPRLGPAFPALVPSVDERGNERGGVRPVEVEVPVASFVPWSLRDGLANPREMADFRGLVVPLPRSEEEGRAAADPRPSVGQLYRNEGEYGLEVRAAIDRLVAAGLMLEEDRERVTRRTAELWQWVMKTR